LLEKAKGTLGAAVGMFNPDYKVSQQNIRDVAGLVAFGNSYGVINLVNWMAADRPKQSQKRTNN
jgi:hypothetical protein